MNREKLLEIFNGDTIPVAVIHEGLKINNQKYQEKFTDQQHFNIFFNKLPQQAQNMLVKLAMSNLQKRYQVNEVLAKDVETLKFI